MKKLTNDVNKRMDEMKNEMKKLSDTSNNMNIRMDEIKDLLKNN